jgi:replicative DNA helicase
MSAVQENVGRVLPHSEEAERLLLASIFAGGTVQDFNVARSVGVKPGAFTVRAHRKVWDALAKLFAAGEAEVGVDMVAEVLRESGDLGEAVSMEELLAMSALSGTSAQLSFYAQRVKWLWDLRHAHRLGAQLVEGVFDAQDREKWVAECTEVGTRLITLGRRETMRLVADHATEVGERVRAIAEGRVDRSRWVESSLASFNKLCKPYNSGLQDDGLVLVGGGSGTGKSVWLRQEAYAALLQGKAVLFISRETGTLGVLAMMASAATGVDLNNLETELPDRLAKFHEVLGVMKDKWADKLLWVVQQEAATELTNIEDVLDLVRAHVHRRGVPAMIVVDYLQLFETKKRTTSREQSVAVVSHALQALQRELGCVLLVAAQLNESGLEAMRTVKKDDQGRVIHRMPKPGDLRESQAMYHDADRVVFLYKPPVDCRGQEQVQSGVPRPEVWVYQEKRRSGGIHHVRCWFEKRYTRFVELTRAEVIEAESQMAAPGEVKPAAGPVSKQDFKKQRAQGSPF